MIVALLCLTLFVDSAKACWWLRQHRGRSQVCRPVACEPASSLPCTDVRFEGHAHGVIVVEDPAGCCCDAATEAHRGIDAAFDHEAVVQVIEHGIGEHAAGSQDSVVVHGPTMVVDAAPSHPAADTSVAQPMPVAAVGPTVLPSPTPAREPIPDLKPAMAAQSPVAPASDEQPMPEPQAKSASEPLAAASAEPSAVDESDEPQKPATPMPATVDDPVGGPTTKLPMPEPREPNLFDLYGDEDDVAPAEEAPFGDGTAEPAEDAAAAAAPAEEAEMSAEDAEGPESEAQVLEGTDDSATSEEAAPAEEPANEEAAEEADASQESEPGQAEADPAAAAVTVPEEPMRHWTDATGTHHTKGWLVAVRADRVRILKVNGRHATVLTESLSAEDRDYVSAVGGRLAAEARGSSPAPSTTAGL